jgi:hypothetical protein
MKTQVTPSSLGKVDLRWIEPNRLALEVIKGGVTVIIHQRDHISSDKWNTIILRASDLRELAKALDKPMSD